MLIPPLVATAIYQHSTTGVRLLLKPNPFTTENVINIFIISSANILSLLNDSKNIKVCGILPEVTTDAIPCNV